VKLLVDMNLRQLGRAAGASRVRGCPLVHYRGCDRAGLRNPELDKEHAFVLVTNDLDFSSILAASAEATPSVVQIRTQDRLS
jgi:predicted nuclease of predicted toxin-antitoxin system